MKRLLKLLILALIPFAMMASESIASDKYKKLAKLKQVSTTQVTARTVAKGMETFYGERISLREVKKRWFRKKTIKEVLSREEIELSNGQILYPNEIEFALVPKYARPPKGDEKAPKGDEKAPKEDD
ncbi:MAG: hypothetical protein HN509_00620 [Halobacteriovoraceae bacterium]|jgi:hypothetical protein|nr:hypothetical protein [Halobacteriovoraceae bacterium]MBT5095445.1 hypothetical protein [Halobacteriovoraceae bacterium]